MRTEAFFATLVVGVFAAQGQEPFNLQTTFPTGVGATSATLRGQVTSYGQATQCLFNVTSNGTTTRTAWIQVPKATDIAYVAQAVTGLTPNSSVTAAIECVPFNGGTSVIGMAYTFRTASVPPTTAPAPVFDPAKIVTAGNPATAGISPYAIVSIFGSNLAMQTLTAPAGNLPTSLGGTSVSFSGIPGYPMYVSPTQINVLVPPTIQLFGTVNVQVNVDAGGGKVGTASGWVASQTDSPGIFLYTDAAGNNLATPGQTLKAVNGRFTVTVYGTGFGLANNIVAGQPAPSDGSATLLSFPLGRFMGAGNTPLMVANVVSAILAGGMVGVDQIIVEIPSGVAAGVGSLQIISQSGRALYLPVNIAGQ
jgi:uncharacterized protein (TIGR03437 family)